MKILRTPEERFRLLPFFPWAPHFLARDWRGESFMAIGLRDPVLGNPVMEELRRTIRGSTPALEVPEAGHFVQEWGEPIARAALEAFGLAGRRSPS